MLRLAALALVFVSCATTYKRPKPGPLPANVQFVGNWDSTWGRMPLEQEGRHVHGTFAGYREGSVSGEVDGNLFRFVWDQRVPRQHGHGFLQISPDGMHVEGRWGYEQDDLQGGRWAADRDTSSDK